MLPRKKEIILYANMTDHQKNIQEHLVNKTLEGYLLEKSDNGEKVISKKVGLSWEPTWLRSSDLVDSWTNL